MGFDEGFKSSASAESLIQNPIHNLVQPISSELKQSSKNFEYLNKIC